QGSLEYCELFQFKLFHKINKNKFCYKTVELNNISSKNCYFFLDYISQDGFQADTLIIKPELSSWTFEYTNILLNKLLSTIISIKNVDISKVPITASSLQSFCQFILNCNMNSNYYLWMNSFDFYAYYHLNNQHKFIIPKNVNITLDVDTEYMSYIRYLQDKSKYTFGPDSITKLNFIDPSITKRSLTDFFTSCKQKPFYRVTS
ncbi:hypothetical protein WA158_006699, partial [Blastocystis sp. Blastoise]